jgi:Co/Zn/Cd efflux system component
LGAGHDAITAHVSCEKPEADLGKKIAEKLRHDFEAEYVTIQIEPVESDEAPPSRFTSV